MLWWCQSLRWREVGILLYFNANLILTRCKPVDVRASFRQLQRDLDKWAQAWSDDCQGRWLPKKEPSKSEPWWSKPSYSFNHDVQLPDGSSTWWGREELRNRLPIQGFRCHSFKRWALSYGRRAKSDWKRARKARKSRTILGLNLNKSELKSQKVAWSTKEGTGTQKVERTWADAKKSRIRCGIEGTSA